MSLTHAAPQGHQSQGLKSMMREYERTLIVSALASSGGHQRRAAAALGILPTTLVEKMKRLGIAGRHAYRHAAPPHPRPA